MTLWLLVAWLLSPGVAAQPAAPEVPVPPASDIPTDERSDRLHRVRVQLDERVENVKAQILPPYAALQRLPADAAVPPLSVYVQVGFEGFVLERAELAVEGKTVARHDYSQREALALLDGGWHRLLHRAQAPGDYRISARLTGYVFEKAESPEAAERLELDYRFAWHHGTPEGEKSAPAASPAIPAASELLLPVAIDCEVISSKERGSSMPIALLRYEAVAGAVRRLVAVGRDALERTVEEPTQPGREKRFPGRHPSPCLERALSGAFAERGHYAPGTEDDPRLRSARFALASDRVLMADGLLREARHLGARPADAAYSALRGDTNVVLGMRQAAEAAYGRLPVGDPRWHAGQLRLAELEYQRGHFAAADRRLGGELPGDREVARRWQALHARVLLARERPEDVVALLDGSQDLDPTSRYNLAIAHLSAGNWGDAEALLDRLGRADGDTAGRLSERAARALAERASLILAQRYLARGQPAEAREALARIRLEGPYGSAALLATGWAWLMDEQPPAAKPLAATGGALFRRIAEWLPGVRPAADPPLLQREQAQAALYYWDLLAQGDAVDPMVQEARLGSAWLLQQGGARATALARYQEAVEGLEEARGLIDEALSSFDHQGFLDTVAATGEAESFARTWEIRGLPDLPATYWTTGLLADHPFQEGLRNYRDLGLLENMLEAVEAKQALDPRHIRVLEQEIAVLRRLQGRWLRLLLAERIEQRRTQVEQHLIRAHLGIARLLEGKR